MKNYKLILLSTLISLSGCALENASLSSLKSSSSSIDQTSSTDNISLIESSTSNNSSNSSNSSSSSVTQTEKTLIIDNNNFDKLSFIELDGVVTADEGYEDKEFTFNKSGVMKSKEIKGIKEIEIYVYQTYENLSVYSNYYGTGAALKSSVKLGNKEATYTYTLNGSSEFYIRNAEDYRTHVYSITIKYTGETLSGGNNSSSSSNNSSSSSSTTNEEINYKQGLKGSEYLEYYGDAAYCESVPSTGHPNMLVVPVLFKNETVSNSSKVLNDIAATFNGASTDTGWESVDSYYKKTSYGKLDLDIDVYDKWVTLDKTCSQLASLNSYDDPTWYVVDYVVNYLKKQNIDMTQYDSNSDGFIDGIWLVYGKNYSSASTQAEEDFLWAYTYWMYENTASITSPVANVYAWASIEFMYEGGYSKPDAHTFIHETGHMLGLDDYYDYTENTTLSPAGCLDMMDYNIGDHNAYSKYFLDWIEPTYVSKSESITIRPFESSGDSIIVPSSLTDYKSPLNEYLIIEFYTPTGLNELDSTSKYTGKYPLLFSDEGVKIYHVDSRIGELEYNYDWEYNSFVYNYTYNDLVSKTGDDNYFQIFTSNTPEYSYNDNYKLLTLLSSYQNSKKNYYYSNTYASNQDLYQSGDSIKSFVFNRGTSLPFEIYIDSVTSENATIRFVKK